MILFTDFPNLTNSDSETKKPEQNNKKIRKLENFEKFSWIYTIIG